MPTIDYSALLAEANDILHRSVPLTKESTARAATLIQLAEAEHRRQSLVKNSRALGLTSAEPSEAHELAFRNYLTAGKAAIRSGAVDQKYLTGYNGEFRNAQSTGTTAGGFITPGSYSDRVQAIVAARDPLFDLSQTLTTVDGNACGYPTIDDSSISAVVKAQNAQSDTDKDVVFGQAALAAASSFRSGMVLVPSELAADSNFNIDSVLAETFGLRLARAIGTNFTSILLGASGSPTAVTAASQTAIVDSELWSLISALDEGFASNAAFMMRKSTYTTLAQIKGTSGNYVLQSGRDSAGRLTLCGFPCYLSGSMGTLTAGSKPIAFGDFGQGFVKRIVANSFTVKRFDETYAESSQIGFQSWIRCSGAVVKGTSVSPIQLLAMHA